MRKGIDRIAQLCREKLNADPFSGHLFIFRSRRGTSIRILQFDGQGSSGEQVAFLREFILAHPTGSRWKLSRQLCEALDWKQANGALRDVVCRGLLLMLDRAGEIELPPVRRLIRGQRRTGRPRPEAVLMDTTLLATLQRHAGELKRVPSDWMPWSYRQTIARHATPVAA